MLLLAGGINGSILAGLAKALGTPMPAPAATPAAPSGEACAKHFHNCSTIEQHTDFWLPNGPAAVPAADIGACCKLCQVSEGSIPTYLPPSRCTFRHASAGGNP